MLRKTMLAALVAGAGAVIITGPGVFAAGGTPANKVVASASHTEVIVTAEGPRIVGTHVRLGGDSIPELIQLVSGVDLEELWIRQTLGESVFDPPPYLGDHPPHRQPDHHPTDPAQHELEPRVEDREGACHGGRHGRSVQGQRRRVVYEALTLEDRNDPAWQA